MQVLADCIALSSTAAVMWLWAVGPTSLMPYAATCCAAQYPGSSGADTWLADNRQDTRLILKVTGIYH